jgi:hypothetical protein
MLSCGEARKCCTRWPWAGCNRRPARGTPQFRCRPRCCRAPRLRDWQGWKLGVMLQRRRRGTLGRRLRPQGLAPGAKGRSHDRRPTRPATVSSSSYHLMACFMSSPSAGRLGWTHAVRCVHQSWKVRRDLLDDGNAEHAGGRPQPRHDIRSAVCPARGAEDSRLRLCAVVGSQALGACSEAPSMKPSVPGLRIFACVLSAQLAALTSPTICARVVIKITVAARTHERITHA